jgi:hypothetical protein
MQDRRLWERAFAANRNGTVRAEETVKPEIAATAIANPEMVTEPRMGSVRQTKRRLE